MGRGLGRSPKEKAPEIPGRTEMNKRHKPSGSTLLTASSSLIQQVPEPQSRCHLWSRSACVAIKEGDLDLARLNVQRAADEMNAISGTLARGFALVELATVCVHCRLTDRAREMLEEVERAYHNERQTGPTRSLALFLIDGIVQLGDMDWAFAVAAEHAPAVSAEMLAAMVKRCALLGRLEPMLKALRHKCLNERREALIAESLILLAERGIEERDARRLLEDLDAVGSSQ